MFPICCTFLSQQDQLEEHVHRNVHLSVYLYYGSGRTKNSFLLEEQDVVITTYLTVSSDFKVFF